MNIDLALELVGGGTLLALIGFLTGYQLGVLERERADLQTEKSRKEREDPSSRS